LTKVVTVRQVTVALVTGQLRVRVERPLHCMLKRSKCLVQGPMLQLEVGSNLTLGFEHPGQHT
jgi:hypothetical protein